jgi:hypothetical protein
MMAVMNFVRHVAFYVAGPEYCEACNISKVLHRDSANWNDFLLDIGSEIKLGSKHKLCVTYYY